MLEEFRVTKSEPPLKTDAEILVLESYTLRDLEIFDSASGGETVFEFCDRTKTDGGSKRLRQRMARPWADVERIRATQQSLSLISTHRQAFTKLPSFITRHVDIYEHEILLMVTQGGPVGFGIEAFLLWVNEDNHYHSIVRGVQYACGLIRALREFVGQPALAAPLGEIAPLFEEMRALLARPKIVEVPDEELRGA